MSFLEINTGHEKSLTIWGKDKDNEVEFEVDKYDASISVYINKDQAIQIIQHLKEQFGI